MGDAMTEFVVDDKIANDLLELMKGPAFQTWNAEHPWFRQTLLGALSKYPPPKITFDSAQGLVEREKARQEEQQTWPVIATPYAEINKEIGGIEYGDFLLFMGSYWGAKTSYSTMWNGHLLHHGVPTLLLDWENRLDQVLPGIALTLMDLRGEQIPETVDILDCYRTLEQCGTPFAWKFFKDFKSDGKFVKPPRYMATDAVIAAIEEQEKLTGIHYQAIALDYIDLLQEEGSKDIWSDQGRIIEELQAYGACTKRVFVSPAQGNRGANAPKGKGRGSRGGSNLRADNIAGGFSKVMKSTIMLIVEPDISQGVTHVEVDKFRDLPRKWKGRKFTHMFKPVGVKTSRRTIQRGYLKRAFLSEGVNWLVAKPGLIRKLADASFVKDEKTYIWSDEFDEILGPCQADAKADDSFMKHFKKDRIQKDKSRKIAWHVVLPLEAAEIPTEQRKMPDSAAVDRLVAELMEKRNAQA